MLNTHYSYYFRDKFTQLSRDIKRNRANQKIQLTYDHLNKFNDIFKKLARIDHMGSISGKIFTEFEDLIQSCDTESPDNQTKLLHLSHLILNHFSSNSIHWILAIYKRVMNNSPKNFHKYTCLDLANTIPSNPSSKYVQFLTQLLSYHIMQKNEV